MFHNSYESKSVKYIIVKSASKKHCSMGLTFIGYEILSLQRFKKNN